jgi:hypothetical protein
MKHLLLASATVLAMACATSAAMAERASISFDNLCDGMDIIVKRGHVALETGNGCDVGANFGAGTIGKIAGRGEVITFGVNLSAKGGEGYQYIYVVDYPFVTGGAWTNFFTQDGKTFGGRQGGGTYTVITGDKPHDRGGLKASTDLN